ncbi:MAG: hypothetical protein JXR96_18800 [Deltaproteobacteria bacterium]|nr:hypothetical protein [Deltaproteobacteria bacterium]
MKALTDFGFDTTDLSVDELLRFKILIRDYAVQVDVHPFVAGVSFDEVSARCEGVQAGLPFWDRLPD